MSSVWTVLSTPDVTVVAVFVPDASPHHAHALLTRAVCDVHPYDPAVMAVTHRCPRCGTDAHGVPSLTNHGTPVPLAVSVSRAPGIAVAAWGTTLGLGIDVERAEAASDAALDAVLCHPSEPTPPDDAARTHAWVRKEAALKAWGAGLTVEPSRVRLSGTSAATDAIKDPVSLLDLVIPGYQACVALRKHRLAR